MPATRKRLKQKGLKSPQERGNIYSYFGETLERDVERVLESLISNGWIIDYIHHKKNSPEDARGKDFTILIWTGNTTGVELSFGVSTSTERTPKSRKKHPTVQQLWLHRRLTEDEIYSRLVYFIRKNQC